MQLWRAISSKTLATTVAALLWASLAFMAAMLWVQPFGYAPSGLSLALGLLTAFVGAVVASFSLRYMRADPCAHMFFIRLAALVSAVLAFIFTDHMALFALGWCVSGWLLAALIGHKADWSEARAAARRTQRSFLISDAALLAALAFLAVQTDTVHISEALARVSMMAHAHIMVIALLLVVAAAIRCALPPFANWLFSSMTAPTPVSALMHAGFVNAGGFVLIRFAPLLEAVPVVRMLVVALGLGAALYGVGIMMVRPDVKRALAGSTVSQMGFMMMSCGLGAYGAALWHIIAHGLFKAWLFLGSGGMMGMKTTQPIILSRYAAAAIVILVMGAALVISSSSGADGRLVPVLLGLATACATVAATWGAHIAARAKLFILGLVMILIGTHGAGLALAQAAVGADAPALVPTWALLLLLMAFLTLWLWQHYRLLHGRGIPARLYVHFINAGALPSANTGDAK